MLLALCLVQFSSSTMAEVGIRPIFEFGDNDEAIVHLLSGSTTSGRNLIVYVDDVFIGNAYADRAVFSADSEEWGWSIPYDHSRLSRGHHTIRVKDALAGHEYLLPVTIQKTLDPEKLIFIDSGILVKKKDNKGGLSRDSYSIRSLSNVLLLRMLEGLAR